MTPGLIPSGAMLAQLAADLERGDADERARNSLEEYCRRSWSGFKAPWHIARLIESLEAVERGDTKRLMIFMPPRHGKSFTATQSFPAWYLGKHPNHSMITASYAEGLARDFGKKVRDAIQDPMHTALFPRCRMSPDSTAAGHFDLEAFVDGDGNRQLGGSYFATGRGGALTGRGAHVFLVDDPLKDRAEANSETIRAGLKSWYTDVALTRMQTGGAIVIIQTRWHEDDLAGWLLAEGKERWTILNLPGIAEEDEPHRKEGEALWPEAFPLPVLEQMRESMGASFAALYQQRPSAIEGAIFKRGWWQRYDTAPQFTRITQSWDTGFKVGKSNDPSACTTWGENAHGFYLLHVLCKRMEFPELVAAMKSQAEIWRPNAVLVEDKASGTSAVQSLQAETRLPIIPIVPHGDKVERANAATPYVQSGRVFIPQIAPWLEHYLTELASFPTAKHDDQVDSTSQALLWMNAGPKKSTGYLNHIEAEIARIQAEQRAKENPA